MVENDVDRTLDALCVAAERPPRAVVAEVLTLVLEIAQEGHEGRPVGTLFTVGSANAVLAHSRALILDPLAGHVPASTGIVDTRLRGTLKQLALLDGAFVVADDGTVVAACRYLDVPATGIALPLGLGSRHVAAASISRWPGIVTIVASSTGVVRAFRAGEVVALITPAH